MNEWTLPGTLGLILIAAGTFALLDFLAWLWRE